MNWYYCKKCNRLCQRESDKERIKSLCDSTGENVITTKVKSADALAKKLSRIYNDQFDWGSTKERIAFEYAFKQGVRVTFNALK